MKLDKRIENERLIYTPFTTNRPKLHEKGYFTDDIHSFKDLEHFNCRYGELVEHDGSDYPFPYCCESDDGCGDGNTTVDWYAFYIPESSLKSEEKEKKFRPYTLQEFLKKFHVGQPIKFRQKRAVGYERYLIVNGYSRDGWNGQSTPYICIGNVLYSLDALFIDYEYNDNCTEDFKPFGVEE